MGDDEHGTPARPGPTGPGEDATGPDETERRTPAGSAAGSGTGGRALVIGGIAAVAIGLGWLAWLVIGGPPGADSPQGAVEDLFTAVDHGDPAAVLATLTPSEQAVLGSPLDRTLGQLGRLGLTTGMGTERIPGADVAVDSLQFRTTYLTPELAAVDVTSGRISVTLDQDALPVTDDGREALDHYNVDLAAAGPVATRDFAQEPLHLVAVDEGQGWHVSILASAADTVRADRSDPLPQATVTATADGAESPQGAIRGLVEAYADGDAARAIGYLAPEEADLLARWGPTLLPGSFGRAPGEGTVSRLDVEQRPDGTWTVTGLAAELDDEVQHVSVDYDGTCLRTAYHFADDEPYASFERCGERWVEKLLEAEEEIADARAAPDAGPGESTRDRPPIISEDPEEQAHELEELGMPRDNAFALLAAFGSGSQLPPITVVEVEGRWYVSAVRTVLHGALDTLAEAEPGEVIDLLDRFDAIRAPQGGEILEEARDPDNNLFGPPVANRNPLVATCFTKALGVAGELGVGEVGAACVEHLIATGRAGETDIPPLLRFGDCVTVEPTPPPALTSPLRRVFLYDLAVRSCIQGKIDAGLAGPEVLGELRDPAAQQCFAPYRALAADAPEDAWAAADAAVLACAAAADAPDGAT